jgi:hypothetical protein
LLLIASPAREQEAVHVAPLAQCRADADAWGIPGDAPPSAWSSPEDEFNNFKRKMNIGAVSSQILNVRNDELMQCVNTDRLYSSRYVLASLALQDCDVRAHGQLHAAP